ncbi:unnamed protein product [Linum tenue]|uniref:Uncharacterized protein n=1 Tax=Linum tenue TaxID=586396 RepID=A0AAV0GSJ5_9ROSI|nr:unnamed protein product [Linum tenue]
MKKISHLFAFTALLFLCLLPPLPRTTAGDIRSDRKALLNFGTSVPHTRRLNWTSNGSPCNSGRRTNWGFSYRERRAGDGLRRDSASVGVFGRRGVKAAGEKTKLRFWRKQGTMKKTGEGGKLGTISSITGL